MGRLVPRPGGGVLRHPQSGTRTRCALRGLAHGGICRLGTVYSVFSGIDVSWKTPGGDAVGGAQIERIEDDRAIKKVLG